MSCELKPLSNFQDFSSVKTFLFPQLKDSTTPEPSAADAGDWGNDDWGWQVEEEEDQTDVESTANLQQTWLQQTIFSLSPTNDLVAIAHDDHIVFLTQKWDPKEKGEIETKFCTLWQGSLKQEEGEEITAIMCIPLASQKRSTHGRPDWTCVLVGFSSGYIRFYTENGTLLMSQLLHEEPVVKLKCRTYEAARYLGMAEQHEELIILYKRALVTIDGFSFSQSLRACRNQVARAAASGGEANLQPPPLAYKKWGLQDQENILDMVSCGVDTPNPFDQMKTASILSGFGASVKATPPAAALYATSGIGPYVGFFYAVEGSTQPMLSEVVYAVANKLKTAFMSAASGWLSFGGKPKVEQRDKRKPKVEAATPLSLRCGLPDKRRLGETIVLSPNSNYAATTDSFGRVILLDVDSGLAVRMWKGYRDAQLGWIEVKDDIGGVRHTDSVRIAQFLIIYAPRRGILEVWTAVNGPRVAAFNVSKGCRLVCPGYGMMGLNNVTVKSVKNKAFQIALVDPKGTVKILEVPFHLALSDKNSKRARDLHLLKKLKTLLKEHMTESEALQMETCDILSDMRVANITQQGLEKVLSSRYVSAEFMQNVLQSVIQRLSEIGEAVLDVENRVLLQFCQIQDGLVHTYRSLQKINTQGLDVTMPTENLSEHLALFMSITPSEIDHILHQVELYQNVIKEEMPAVHVRFEVDDSLGIIHFLNSFHHRIHRSEGDASKVVSLSVSKHISEERKVAFGKLVFQHCLEGSVSPSDLNLVLQSCGLPPEQLMELLITYWLSTDNRMAASIENLYYIIKSVTSVTEKSEVVVDHGVVSPWWQKIRDSCSQSENICAAILLAMVARSVALEIQGSQTKAKDPDADTACCNSSEQMDTSASEWESITMDIEQWTTLIKQLEDLLTLSAFLKVKGQPDRAWTMAEESLNGVTVSVSKLLEGGRGSIPEVVARYVASNGLSPITINNPSKTSDGETVEFAKEVVDEGEITPDKLRSQLDVLRGIFPHSLDNDVLMANCGWEYAVQWNKNPEVIGHFQSSLNFIKLVQNAVLKQGVCSMFWHMFIVKRMTSAAYLMEKVGKFPKERLCRKEVGLSDIMIAEFLKLVCDFLEVLQDANCDANEVPVFNMEPLWQNVRGSASLVELAVEQKVTNYGLVRHHYHLALIMYAVLHFNMKSLKVLSQFDTKGKNSFFKDLHSHPLLPNQNVDSSISLARRQFLSRVISQAVRTTETLSNNWPSTVLELAKDFGLDIDFFKRHHVCELYSEGHDKQAEEILSTVNDHELMGSQLVLIAGQRLAHYIYTCDPPGALERVASLSPTVSTWLKSMESVQLRRPNVPFSYTALLLGHVVNQLPEGYSEYNLAVSLVELVQSLS